MNSLRPWLALTLCGLLVPWCLSCAAQAEDAPKSAAAQTESAGTTVEIAEGTLALPVPSGWKQVAPRFRIIEHEFEIPAAEGDEQAGRATVSQSGGSIDDNIARWIGQFSQPDGSNTAEKAKVSDKQVAEMPVKIVEIAGTYDDKPGPFSPTPGVKRENYKMLAAIVSTKKAGNYYLKFYGPAKTIDANADAFMKMVEGLQAK